MNGRITQADVARQAGVHATTVSLALRNHPSLPAATREHLRALAAKMGYRPDPDLRALMAYRRGARQTKPTATLAYVTHAAARWSWKKAPAHAQFFAGATARAAQLGYSLEHFWLGEPGLTQQRMNEILVSRGISGVILASQWRDTPSVQFDWSRLCSVKIDFLPPSPVLHNVTNDQRAIIQLAMRKVSAAGYRRIGLIMPRWWDELVDLAWSAGFLAAQATLPKAHHVPMLLYDSGRDGSPPPESADFTVSKLALQTWLRRHRPEVVISHRPFLGQRFRELGVRMPGDVALVELFLEDFDGQTAGVRQNCQRVGEVAVEILASQLQQHSYGLPAFPTATLVEGTWFEGASLPGAAAPEANHHAR